MGTVPGVTIGPITAIHQDPPALDVGGAGFLVAHPALLSGLKLEDRVIVVWEQEGPGRRAVRITPAHLDPPVIHARLPEPRA